MTTRRRLLLFVLLAVAVVLGFGAWLFWPRVSRSDENYEKIALGMTRGAMESLLGRPGDQPDEQLHARRLERRGDTITHSQMKWYGERFVIEAYLDNGIAEYDITSPGDKVVSFEIYEVVEYQYPSPLERVRYWLRL